MMTLEARIQKIAELLRAGWNKGGGWAPIKLARIGTVTVHVERQDLCKLYGWNEVWARIGDHEFRGSAEAVAKELCKLLKAPSKAVAECAEDLKTKTFDSYREPEIAALFGLDEALTFKVMEYLAEQGAAVNRGELGWFRP